MNANDAQTWRDISFFTKKLLLHTKVLPPDLIAMLSEYESELDSASPGRWDGVGGTAQYEDLAQHISQSIADGEIPSGTRLEWPLDYWYCRAQTRENIMNALRILAVRGELDRQCEIYYVRLCDGGS
jgi:hypothetical protein